MVHDAAMRRRLLALTLVATLALAGFMLWPFVQALLWALVFSLLTQPLLAWYSRRLARLPSALRNNVSSGLTVVTTALIFALPGVLLAVIVLSQVDEWTRQNSVSALLASLEALRSIGSGQVSAWLVENREDLNRSIQTVVLRSGSSLAAGSLQLIFALLTQFFLLRDGSRLRRSFIEYAPLGEAMSERLFTAVRNTARAVFVGTVIVALLQGAITWALLAVTSVPYSALLGALATLCAVVPMVGAPVVYVPAAIWLFSEGRTPAALVVLLGGILVVSQIDNLVKPFLIGSRTGLHPMAVFFAILSGLALFGPVGVMAGPMFLSALLVLLEAWGKQDSLEHEAIS